MHRVPGHRVPFVALWHIDEIAADARRALSPSTAPDECLDMARILETVDGRKRRLPSGVEATVKLAVEELPKHVLGETRLVDDRIYIGIAEMTYRLMCVEEGWARFTAAHEVGHVTMHLATLTKLKTMSQYEVALARVAANHHDSVDSEVQANNFAAAFLAPNEGLRLLDTRGRMSVESVMCTFGMGRKSATARINNYRRRRPTRRRGRGGG